MTEPNTDRDTGADERVTAAASEAKRAEDAEVGTEQAAEEATAPDSPTVSAPSPQESGEVEPPTGESEEASAEDDPRTPEELRAALVEAERARDQYLDFLRRERAEFENFRKRTTRERMDALDRGAEQLVANLLGVLDNFGFALEAAENSDDDQLAKGVQMVHNEFLATLQAAGLEEVAGAGAPFDPEVHEAMLQVEADEPLDEPIVVEVLRPGYRFKRRVLRPASVKVAR